LGYEVASSGLGEFTFRVTNLDVFNEDYSIYLYDLDDDVIVNLKEDSTYTFTPSETQSDDRFEIRFSIEAVSTSIGDEQTVVSGSDVFIYSAEQKATIEVSDDLLLGSDRKIELYNLAGQLISTYELNTNKTEIDLPQTNTMYLIKVRIDATSYQDKVVSMN
jgi:hypothetical protein